MTYRVERHKWWDATKSRLVNSGDPEAAFLAYPAGTELAESEARRVGLLTGVHVQPPTEAEKIRKATPANKLGRVPADKSVKPDEETL